MSRHVVVMEVTQPFHGAGGEVVFSPGQRFPEGTDLPEGVRTRLVIAEAPPEPPAAAQEASAEPAAVKRRTAAGPRGT